MEERTGRPQRALLKPNQEKTNKEIFSQHRPQKEVWVVIMDLLHSWGVELAVYLQTSYGKYEGLFDLASTVADLHTTFFWFFPIWFHLRRDTALRLIWVAVIGDWLNLVLKW